MSAFVACFGTPKPEWSKAIIRNFREDFGLTDIRELASGRSTLVYAADGGDAPEVHNKDPDGWVLVQGLAVDVRALDPRVQPDELLRKSLASGEPDLDRYEGAFALMLWDKNRSTGWFCNDHASVRNVYYCEHGGSAYVTTAPVALARTLGLGLSQDGFREFLTRGCVLAPTSLFDGIRRLDVGEKAKVQEARIQVKSDWCATADQAKLGLDESTTMLASVLVDRMRRINCVAPSAVADLTGRLDSRVLNLARAFSLVDVAATVNGPSLIPMLQLHTS